MAFKETPLEILHKRQNPRISRAQKDFIKELERQKALMRDKQKVAEQIKEIEGMGFGSPDGWQKTPTGYTFTVEYGNGLANEFNKLAQEQKDPLDEWIEEWIRKNGG